MLCERRRLQANVDSEVQRLAMRWYRRWLREAERVRARHGREMLCMVLDEVLAMCGHGGGAGGGDVA